MMRRSTDPSADDSLYDLEFRATDDDAWYSIRAVLCDDVLVVKYWNFSEETDERFSAGDFEDVEAIENFTQRFRPTSQQLQDSRCSRVIEGMTVCASFTFGDDDIRFYDAVVEAVRYGEHSFAKEEECQCTFMLFWQHGPNEGDVTSTSVANICLIQHFARVDFRLASFSTIAKEKIAIGSLKENSLLSTNQKAKEGSSELCCVGGTKEGRINNCHERNLKDITFGGESSTIETGFHNFILVENLEKDLLPSSVMAFVHDQTSVVPQAYVFPSLSSELHTRGAIVLDCKKKLNKIFEFLTCPDHMVISSRGRPWVIGEKVSLCGTFRTTLGSLMPKSQCNYQNRSIRDELKIVHRGTNEHRTAKRLRNLFMDFAADRERLQNELALKEKNILQR